MTTPNPVPASYVLNVPNQVPQVQLTPYSDHRKTPNYLAKIRRTAIIQIIGGVLLVVLGILAINFLANWSYSATPIWSGIMFFILTGCLGLLASSTKNQCAIAAFLTMSIFSCMMGFALLEMYIFAAQYEEGYDDYNYDSSSICHPGSDENVILDCQKSEATRRAIDIAISATGLFLFVLCIVGASFGCCAKCACCAKCCQQCCGGGCSSCCTPPPPPTTAACVAPGGFVQANALGPQQGGVQYPQQGMFLIQQNQTVAMPPPGTSYPQVVIPEPEAPPPAYDSHMAYGTELSEKGQF